MKIHFPKGINKTVAFVILLAVCVASYPTNTASGSPASPPLVWMPRASMPTARYYFGAALAGDGNIYIVGGDNYTNIPLNIVEAYNPVTNSWTSRAVMPTARWRFGAATGPNGRIYAIGGATPSGPLGNVEEYDAQTDTWAVKTNMPTPRAELGVVAWNGRIFAIGGWNESGNLAIVEEYNPATDTWTTHSSMPTPNSAFGVQVAGNGKIYVFGGVGGITAYEFDPDADSWTALAPMPTGRAALAVAAENEELYVVGGCCWGGANVLSTVEVYDPDANMWETQTSLLTPRASFGLVSTGNGALFAIGGWGPGGYPGNNGYGALATVEAAGIIPILVALDILPGSSSNSIDPDSAGVVPVAVLTTAAFDATLVDPSTVRFGPQHASPSHGTGVLRDTDHDGDLDLLLRFRIQETGIQCGDESASLYGVTYQGNPLEGSDTIQTVTCR